MSELKKKIWSVVGADGVRAVNLTHDDAWKIVAEANDKNGATVVTNDVAARSLHYEKLREERKLNDAREPKK